MYPEDLHYTPEHEWVRREGANLRFGITSFAADALGDVVYVQLPAMAAELTAGEPCGEVESTKSVSDIFAPVSGRVSALNGELEDAPELVNVDPYGQGWMVEVECDSEDEAETAWDQLLNAEQYRAGLD